MIEPPIQTHARVSAYGVPYAGIDQSLTSTGVAILHGGKIKVWTIPIKASVKGLPRLFFYEAEIDRILREEGVAGMAMEGYSFGSRQSHAHSLGELGGVIKMVAYRLRVPTLVASPSTVKLMLTGKGNTSKSMMPKEVFKRYGVDCGDDNQADATVLATIAACHFNGYAGSTGTERKALAAVEMLPGNPTPIVRLRTRAAA